MRGKITKSEPAQRRTTKQLRRTAIHEAGHAVVGRVLGTTCGEATIVPDYDEMTAGAIRVMMRARNIGSYRNRPRASQSAIDLSTREIE
jgi:ATP-dependent Zn protease